MIIQTSMQAVVATQLAKTMKPTSQPTRVSVVDVTDRAMKNAMADLRSHDGKSEMQNGGFFTASVLAH